MQDIYISDILKTKKDLVFAHKIISHLEMDDLTYTHLSSRSPEERDRFFLSPFGKCFCDVKIEDILEIDKNGDLIGKSLNKEFNPTGVIIHKSIYQTRADINSIIHLHTNASIAVSALKSGLLPVSQHAMHFYNHVSYHDYDSLNLSEEDQGKKMAEDLGRSNKVLMLRNHGFITIGKTIWEALFFAYHLERACKIQCLLSGLKNEEIIIPSNEICEKTFNDLTNFEKDLGRRDWEAWKIKLNYEN